MSQVLFVIAPHSAECKAEVSLDRSETRRLADKLDDRFLAHPSLPTSLRHRPPLELL